MPRNGQGVFSRAPGTTVAPLTTIESAVFNAVIDDLVADANIDRPISAGGTGASTAVQARINLDLVKATGTSDTATGRLALIGSFGLGGGGIAVPGDDPNTIAASGVYVTSGGTTTNVPWPTANNGVIQHVERGSGRAFQIGCEVGSTSNAVLWQRQLSGAGWSQWAKIAALIDESSNANGAIRKWSDGRMECYHSMTFSAAISEAFMGGFRAGAVVWTYPAPFSTAPIFIPVVESLTAGGVIVNTNDAAQGSFALTAFTSQTSASRTVRLFARGRWN